MPHWLKGISRFFNNVTVAGSVDVVTDAWWLTLADMVADADSNFQDPHIRELHNDALICFVNVQRYLIMFSVYLYAE